MKKVLAISLGWEQEPFLVNLAKRNGFELYGLNYNNNYNKEIPFTRVECLDFRNISYAIQFAKQIKPDAVISDEDDYGMFLQAIISNEFGLPGPQIEQAQIACNKFIQRSVAREQGIKIPNFSLCKSSKDVLDFGEKNSYPLIIKPIDSRGSIGVSKIEHPEEINSKFLLALYSSPSLLTIVEQYIEGEHFNVDGYCFDGKGLKSLAVSQNSKLTESKGIINDSIVYGSTDSNIRKSLMKQAEKVANFFGYNFGFFHGEFIRSRETGEIFLTEMANRGGGILISQKILPFTTKLPLADIYINDCLGNSNLYDYYLESREDYARIDFVSLESGRVFKGLDKNPILEYEKDIIDIVPFLSIGDTIPKVENGSKRHIMILSSIRDEEKLNIVKSLVKSEVYSDE
ncbi:ATP-grasp domain-containing protein [Leptospira noguchii]|uniref:ATP-grasp domain protein n=1 Tax=Leptospira noguchii str. 2007001578 TaxID=1049974 RepID=A0ABP2TA63_9LEPT|nr:ATP-grasp domain-containing protein [Leptospira noguchii]EMN01221.1 ATP-grasp domain protein [Leptospira noguchii str. 2007001578]